MDYIEDRTEFVTQNLTELVECTKPNSELINQLLSAKLITTSEHQTLVSEKPNRINDHMIFVFNCVLKSVYSFLDFTWN